MGQKASEVRVAMMRLQDQQLNIYRMQEIGMTMYPIAWLSMI
jgi:hypothetical protein